MSAHVVIVGASIGGVRTAQALRTEGHDGPITLIGAEPELPYDKPPLSKQFLAGAWDERRVTLLDKPAAQDARIELRLGTPATGLDVAGHRLQLADGSAVGYDQLVVATGAAPRPSPWTVDSGVHLLRTLGDARALRAALQRTGPVVIVGGGFIGAEVAATAHAAGRPVTVVDPLAAPAERVAGPQIGALLADVHRRHGVATRLGTGVASITGGQGDLTVALSDGKSLAADTVLVAIGVTPSTDWLQASGLLVQDGLVCGADCRSVDAADVFGVGDAARWFHAGHEEAVRVEHWTNAAEQAGCVAHNIVHPDDPREHRPTEFVWSDQYDWRIQIAGRPGRCDRHELIGDAETELPRFVALYRSGDARIAGAVAVNWPRALIAARRDIARGVPFDETLATIGEMTVPG